MDKENQHFVPQGYLRRFTVEGEKSLIWEYDKNTGTLCGSPKSVRGICSRKNYYAHPLATGDLDKTILEDNFGKLIESPAIRVIDKIPHNAKSPFTLEDKDKEILSIFKAISLTRNPSVREGVKDFHENIGKRVFEIMLPELLKDAPDIVKNRIKKGGLWNALDLNAHNWVSNQPMIDMANQGANTILRKSWMFFKPPPTKHFVTCDNPVVFSPPTESDSVGFLDSGIGPFHPMSTIRYPLRKDLMFISMEGNGEQINEYQIQEISEEMVDLFNQVVIRNALRYVYSSKDDQHILEVVKQLKGSGVKLVAH